MNERGPASFEEKLKRIDTIVKELESSDTELARAIDLFKEGKTLASECEAMLRHAQEQVDRAIDGTSSAPTE